MPLAKILHSGPLNERTNTKEVCWEVVHVKMGPDTNYQCHSAERTFIPQAHAVSTQLLETAATQTKTPINVSA